MSKLVISEDDYYKALDEIEPKVIKEFEYWFATPTNLAIIMESVVDWFLEAVGIEVDNKKLERSEK